MPAVGPGLAQAWRLRGRDDVALSLPHCAHRQRRRWPASRWVTSPRVSIGAVRGRFAENVDIQLIRIGKYCGMQRLATVWFGIGSVTAGGRNWPVELLVLHRFTGPTRRGSFFC